MTKKTLLTLTLGLILLLLCAVPGYAADSLNLCASKESAAGSSQKITWTCSGGAPACYDMRVYCEGKLIAKSRLDGWAEAATISGKTLDKAGNYSVKLFAIEKDNSYIVSEVAFEVTGTSGSENAASSACQPVKTEKAPRKQSKAPSACQSAATPEPTAAPTAAPTQSSACQSAATPAPTANVTPAPTANPTAAPTVKPTAAPTAKPTAAPTAKPTSTAGVSGTSKTAMADEVVRQTNSDRAKNGLGALTVDADLTRAACVRAQEIVKSFSHTRPDGSSALSVSSKAKGENIAKGQQTADKVMAAWMSSDGHRANILRTSFKSIGVCAYEVNGIMYWVQLFGY